jgi:hypothetical protein
MGNKERKNIIIQINGELPPSYLQFDVITEDETKNLIKLKT